METNLESKVASILEEATSAGEEVPEEVRKRWFFWNLQVSKGLKHNFQGAPDTVVTKKSKLLALEDADLLVVDTSERDGYFNKRAKRRSKNQRAKASRKANR